MPHVIIKMLAGRSDDVKSRLAAEITRTVMEGANCAENSVSVSIEDIAPDRWTDDVYEPDIVGKQQTLFKKPGYGAKI